MGGEEFCRVLPYTGTEEALGVAERIRHQLEAATLRRADTAVYAAKRQGRNRVVAAAADDPTETGRPVLAADDEMVAAG